MRLWNAPMIRRRIWGISSPAWRIFPKTRASTIRSRSRMTPEKPDWITGLSSRPPMILKGQSSIRLSGGYTTSGAIQPVTRERSLSSAICPHQRAAKVPYRNKAPRQIRGLNLLTMRKIPSGWNRMTTAAKIRPWPPTWMPSLRSRPAISRYMTI